MSKTYTVADSQVPDDQKTITISEDVLETREEKTTIALLKEEYQQQLDKIEAAKVRANEIVDEITDVETNTTLTVTDKPTKLT